MDRGERLVDGSPLGIGLHTAVDVLVFGDQAAQDGLSLPHLRKWSLDASRVGLHGALRTPGGSEDHVLVVGLKENCGAGLVTDHLPALLEHELQRLFHRLARRFLDELVHEQVAGRFHPRNRDCVGARELGARAQRQGDGEPSVVVIEVAGLLAQQDKATDLITDMHRHRHQACDRHVLGKVADELGQPSLVAADVSGAGLDRVQQRSGTLRSAAHRLWVEALEAYPRRLWNEQLAVGR